MKSFCRVLAAALVAAALVGCGNKMLSAPTSSYADLPMTSLLAQATGSRALVTTQLRSGQRDSGVSWMSPDASREPALLYVTDTGNGTVTAYAYKNGSGLGIKGRLKGFLMPMQPCVDPAGNVFIPDFRAAQIREYAHGGTAPIQVLADSDGLPTGCSVDRASGDLAVANIENNMAEQGSIDVYTAAKGTPRKYTDAGVYHPEYCGYDNHGNLFIDGHPNDSSATKLGELKKRAAAITDLTITGGSIVFPGNVQWGGVYLLVGDQEGFGSIPSSLNTITVSGTSATIVKNTPFAGAKDITGFWKQGTGDGAKIATADFGNNDAPIYTYPNIVPFATITKDISSPFGTVVSEAPKIP